MNEQYLVFDQSTGRIAKAVQCPVDAIHLQVGTHQDYISGSVQDDLHFVNTTSGHLTARPELPVTHLGNTLQSVPAGAVITIEGVPYTADGSVIELSFAYPGRYTVDVAYWPYLDWSTTIEVTA